MNSDALEYLEEIERTTGAHINASDGVTKEDLDAALKIILEHRNRGK